MTDQAIAQPVDEIGLQCLELAKGVVDLDWYANGEATRFEEIGAESLDLLNLSMAIERHYKISLVDVSPYDFPTVGEMFAVVRERINAG